MSQSTSLHASEMSISPPLAKISVVKRSHRIQIWAEGVESGLTWEGVRKWKPAQFIVKGVNQAKASVSPQSSDDS